MEGKLLSPSDEARGEAAVLCAAPPHGPDPHHLRPKAAAARVVLSGGEDSATRPMVETAAWGYVRVRLETYSDDDLEQWAERPAATKWGETFVYFMHEPTAPAYAKTLMKLAAQR